MFPSEKFLLNRLLDGSCKKLGFFQKVPLNFSIGNLTFNEI